MNSIFDNSEEEESINVNIYKPRGLFSGLKWFARRQKNDEPSLGIKSYKFKITKKDIEKCKRAGIDLRKLENPDISSKKIFRHQGQMAVIPKNEMDCDFWKEVTTNSHSRAYKNHFVSRSTISVKSKLSTTKFNYIHNIKSEISTVDSCSSSKLNYKVGHRRKPNMRSVISSTQTNIFLKSVPTAILKSNTQKKLLVIDRFKPHRDDVTLKVKRKNDQKDNVTERSNVLPTILTKIESMEEKLCGIEEKTKKISEVVSQNNLQRTPDTSEAKHLGTNKNSFVPNPKKNHKAGQNCRKQKKYSKKKPYRKNKTTAFEDVIRIDSKHASEGNNEIVNAQINFKPRFDWNGKKIEPLRFGSNQPVNFSNQLLNITKVNSSDVEKLIKPLGVQVVGSMSPDKIGLLYEIVKSSLPKHAVEGLLGTIDNSNSALDQSFKNESENKDMSKNSEDDSERNDVYVDESYPSNFDTCQPKSNPSLTYLNHENEINDNNGQENTLTSSLKEESSKTVLTEIYSRSLDNIDLPSIKGQQEETVDVGLSASENILKPCKSSQTLADDLETICIVGGGGDQQSSVLKFPRPLEKQLKPSTIASSKVEKEPKVCITVLVQGVKNDVELKSNLMPTHLEISKDTTIGFHNNEQLPALQSYGPKGDCESSFGKIEADFKKVDFEPIIDHFDVFDNLTSVSCGDSVLENTLPVSPPTLKKHLFINNRENFYKKASEEDEFPHECRGTYLNYEKRKAFDRKILGSKQNKIEHPLEQVGPIKSSSSFSNTFNEYKSLFETYFTHQESCDNYKKLSIGQEHNCNNDNSQQQNYKKALLSSESLKSGNSFDIKRTSSKYMLKNCDFFCKNISTTLCSKLRNHIDLNSSELERSQESSLVYPLTKENIDEPGIEQSSKGSRKIAASFSSVLHKQPIIEELEGNFNDSSVPDCHTQIEKAVAPRVLNSKEIVTVEETEYLKTPPEKKTSKEELNETKEIDCQDKQEAEPNKCINDYKIALDVSEILISEVGRKEVTTMTSILQIPVKTAISSTSVQTDWSLVGITPEHFNTKKTTISVACQTEQMAHQLAETPKHTENFPKYCNCFMNSQFSELAPSDITLTIAQMKPIICAGRSENSPLSEVLEIKKYPNQITEPGIVEILGKHQNEEETKALAKKQTRTNFNSGNICKEKVKPKSFQNLLKEEDQEVKSMTPEVPEEDNVNILKHKTYDKHHKCGIPCFTCVSDDTVLSNSSDLTTQELELNLNSDTHTATLRSSSKNESTLFAGCCHRALGFCHVVPYDAAKSLQNEEKNPFHQTRQNCTLTNFKNKKQTTDSFSCYKDNMKCVAKNVKKGCATFPSPR